jgi:hypothetical protein
LVFGLQSLLKVHAHERQIALGVVTACIWRDQAVSNIEENVAHGISAVLFVNIRGQVVRPQIVESDSFRVRWMGNRSRTPHQQ